MHKPPENVTPGDPMVTPDRRRWRIAKLQPSLDRVMFLAQDVDNGAILSADVCSLEWREDEKAWVMADRRSDPERRNRDRSDENRRQGWQ